MNRYVLPGSSAGELPSAPSAATSPLASDPAPSFFSSSAEALSSEDPDGSSALSSSLSASSAARAKVVVKQAAVKNAAVLVRRIERFMIPPPSARPRGDSRLDQ